MATNITYRKTKTGEWVAYGPAESIRSGTTVTVVKRDGTTKSETITRVGKRFTVNGIDMCYGYLAPQTRTRTPRCSNSPTCDNCGSHGAYVERTDSSGFTGLVCRSCAAEDRHSLSFA